MNLFDSSKSLTLKIEVHQIAVIDVLYKNASTRERIPTSFLLKESPIVIEITKEHPWNKEIFH